MLQEKVFVKVPVGLIITLACLSFEFKGETEKKNEKAVSAAEVCRLYARSFITAVKKRSR